MGTISLRRLSDKTLARYLELEKNGQLTPRQERALAGHRLLTPMVELAHLAVVMEKHDEK